MKKITLPMLSAIVLLGFISTSSISAFSFTPISRTFTPSGRGTTQSFRITNEEGVNIAVQLKMLTREIDEEGKEHNEPADNFFTVYPSQIVLQPDTSQTVKVHWTGPEDIETERCFRILAEQLPVDFGEESADGGNLKILFKYMGSVYITPPEADPDVRINSVEIEEEEGEPRAVLLIENRGNRHAILADLELTLSSSEGSDIHLSGEKLEGLSGTNILPGGKRRFSVSVPEEFSGGDIDASLSYDNPQ
ncbi:MAG: fimbria/pilus periplasmic chaperone [Spirochaetia bacterium]